MTSMMSRVMSRPVKANNDAQAKAMHYRIGRGEQGVLTTEPYTSALLPLWRFRTPREARTSSQLILEAFDGYKSVQDFAGMDMARQFLQMGWTRARRYANHRSGRKYDGPVPREHRGQSGAWGRTILPPDPDPEKAKSAAIFLAAYRHVLADADYQRLKAEHACQTRSRA